MRIATIEIQLKKNHTEVTKWAIHQERPYPCITSKGCGLEWENTDGLFPRNGRPSTGIGCAYRAVLLVPGFKKSKATNDRKDYAGFDGNPSIVYRGKSLGEVYAEIRDNRIWFPSRYLGENLTPSARGLLQEQVVPGLLEYVVKHADVLKKDAVEGLTRSVAARLEDARQDLLWLELEMREALSNV